MSSLSLKSIHRVTHRLSGQFCLNILVIIYCWHTLSRFSREREFNHAYHSHSNALFWPESLSNSDVYSILSVLNGLNATSKFLLPWLHSACKSLAFTWHEGLKVCRSTTRGISIKCFLTDCLNRGVSSDYALFSCEKNAGVIGVEPSCVSFKSWSFQSSIYRVLD